MSDRKMTHVIETYVVVRNTETNERDVFRETACGISIEGDVPHGDGERLVSLCCHLIQEAFRQRAQSCGSPIHRVDPDHLEP